MPREERLIELALKGLQAERAKIDSEIADIRKQLGSPAAATADQTAHVAAAALPAKKKKTMSAAAKRKISASMKRRYAEMRKAMAKK